MAKIIKIGLKSKTDKIRLFSDKNGFDINDFGDTHINFTSNKKVVIDGCKSVIDYDDTFITLNLGKKVFNMFGTNLEIIDFTESEITIIGNIARAEFGE